MKRWQSVLLALGIALLCLGVGGMAHDGRYGWALWMIFGALLVADYIHMALHWTRERVYEEEDA